MRDATKSGTADLRNVERAVLACSMLRYYSAFARAGDAAIRRASQHVRTFALSYVPHREVFSACGASYVVRRENFLFVEICVLHSFFMIEWHAPRTARIRDLCVRRFTRLARQAASALDAPCACRRRRT
ncbi:hypothetical protein QCE47_06625 [Caballeronia sp. LZ025]|uniref:hypothetical protein n=1 Tax=Caballeronia TaxID=1827195 RepID=UPI001FD15737|nr:MULTISPECIES: hypothetical protein [Caballeronia]MDR5732021.1 hypothetical protein [Caballeronia sp. LZ025]